MRRYRTGDARVPAQSGVISAEGLQHNDRDRPFGAAWEHGGQMGRETCKVEGVLLDLPEPAERIRIDHLVGDDLRPAGLGPGAVDVALEGREQRPAPCLPVVTRRTGGLEWRPGRLPAMAGGDFRQRHGDATDQHQRQRYDDE